MKSIHLFLLALAFGFASCTPVAKVKEIKPQRAGFETRSNDPIASLGDSIRMAESAWRTLEANPGNAAAQKDYNFAVARICGTLRQAKLAPWKKPIQAGGYTLAWKRDPRPEWNPALYEIIPADQLELSGTYLTERQLRAGLGAPAVARRLADPVHEFAPTPHFYYAATAVVRFAGSRCEIALEDPLQKEHTRVGRRKVPLAADFTAPLAMMLVEMHPEKLELPRLLHPAKYSETNRIGRLAPYDPNKTVVLVVHGLMSSPATWFPLINHLRKDEAIRRNYQFWFYSYPTGYPYSYSAAILRRELDHIEKKFPMRKKMVVVGHSMGGCISRLLVTNAQRKIWDQLFTVPPEKMEVTPEHAHILAESSIFSHRPEIGRVVFISSPLRGATLASSWLGRLGARLVQLPADLLNLGKEIARYEKPAKGHHHLDRFPDSVDTLSPDNAFVRALDTVPIVNGLPYHTIAGDRGRGDAPKSSDGLVPYWSSHLPAAKSEKIVPSHHSAHQHPEAIAEVHRILMLNAKAQ